MFNNYSIFDDERTEALNNSLRECNEYENFNIPYHKCDEQLNEEYENRLYFIKPYIEKKEIQNPKGDKEPTTANSKEKKNEAPVESLKKYFSKQKRKRIKY